MQMHQPQEIEVWYVIPAIRREMAKELKNSGVKATEISKILGITRAAVSQYLSDKRAKSLVFSKQLKQEIKSSSKAIQKNPGIITGEIQKIIQRVRETGLLCEYHKKYSGINDKCTICME